MSHDAAMKRTSEYLLRHWTGAASAFLSFFFPVALFAQHDVLEQRVTLRLEQATLEQSLAKLITLTGIQFSYSDDVVPLGSEVNSSFDDAPLKVVLAELLRGTGIEYKVSNNRIILRKSPEPFVHTIRGTVSDYQTHMPVAGATLLVLDREPLIGAVSDADGKFRIANVPVGRISLRISSVGYSPRTIDNFLLGTGKEVVLDVQLSESITALEQVIITANADTLATFANQDINVRSFSMEETKRYAGSIGDPARTAASFAGVVNASDETNALIVRGNSPRGLLWRLNGIEVPNPNHFATEGASNGIISIVSPNIIDNSFLLTGAFPAAYGNALSGVLDLRLRKGNDATREHSFQGGVLGMEASTEGPFAKKVKGSYLFNYRYSTLNVLKQLGVSINGAGQYRDYHDGAFHLHLPAGKAGNISAFGISGRSKAYRTLDALNENDFSNIGIAAITHDVQLNRNHFLRSYVSWSGTRIGNFSEVAGIDTAPVTIEQYYKKSFLRSSIHSSNKISGKMFLQAGMIFTRLRYDFHLINRDPNLRYDVIVNFGDTEKGRTGIVQAFATADHRISERISASYGVHLLHFQLTDESAVEPRAQLRWRVGAGKSITAAYGKHSRIENLQYYLARDHQAGGNEIQINKSLGFTRADHYGVAYAHSFQRKVSARLEVYYQQLYNAPVQSDPNSIYTSINEDTGFISDTLVNKGTGKNYGIEFSLEKSFKDGFYYLLNGSVYSSTFRILESSYRNSSYDGNYNVHVLAGREFWRNANRSTFGINVKVTGAGGKPYVPIDLQRSIAEGRQVYDIERAFVPRYPAYFRTDLQLVYRKNKPAYSTEWRLDIQNVSNHSNAAYYFYDVQMQNIRLKNQVGIIPVLSYRIEF